VIKHLRYLLLPMMLCVITGCSAISPTYINDGDIAKGHANQAAINPVHFKVEDSFKNTPPTCIAILPLKNAISTSQKEVPLAGAQATKIPLDLNDEVLEQLRWNLYSHLSPYEYRDVELAKVNKVIASVAVNSSNYSAIGKALKCDALLLGEVIDYSSTHFGIYSHASIGVRMQLVRAINNEVIWQGHHIAKSQAGSVPLTPIDIIIGIYSATENVSEEQLVRVEDDLFRRLLSTWDTRNLSIDEPGLINVAKHVSDQDEFVIDDGYPYSIVVKNLYLRSGPGTRFTAQTVLNQQDKLAIVDHKHTPWLQVQVADGQLGYVNKKYIKSVEVLQSNEQLALLDNGF